MASQWLRWNLTSHIFEYSTDNGTSFIPLPLDASILNQGTLNPAVIPGGTGPSLSGNNIWTGTNLYSGTAPNIIFSETDQGANLKSWYTGIETGLYRILTLADNLGALSTLFTLDRSGQFTYTAPGGADHNIVANADGHCLLNFQNNSAGTNPTLGLSFRNNVGLQGYVLFTGSNNTNAIFAPDALNLYSTGAGGINIRANAGAIILNTVGVNRLTIASSGSITISSTINAVNGYLEFNRSVASGVFTAIPFVASDFGGNGAMTWPVVAGNVVNWGYSIKGKEVTLHIDIANSTIGGTGSAFLTAKIPAAITPNVGCVQPMWMNAAAIGVTGYGIITAGATQISFYKDATLSQNWVPSTNNNRVSGKLIWSIA